jgi:hypothetical protein
MREINLQELTRNGEVRNLAGHDRGLEARNLFDIDKLDAADEAVRVVVPEQIYLLSPSFIQGMFAKSIKALGNRERFLAHYGFDANSAVLQQIDNGINASLMERGSLLQRH